MQRGLLQTLITPQRPAIVMHLPGAYVINKFIYVQIQHIHYFNLDQIAKDDIITTFSTCHDSRAVVAMCKCLEEFDS